MTRKRKITASVENVAVNAYSKIKSNPVKVSFGYDEDSIIDAIMNMSRDELEKLYLSVVRKYYKMFASDYKGYTAQHLLRDIEKHIDRHSERDIIDTLVYLVSEGAIVPTKKASKGTVGASRKIRCASDLTDKQAQDLITLSEFAADIIKETERDYGKKMSQDGWAQVMDLTEDLIRDPSHVEKTVGKGIESMKMHLESVIYDIYEDDTGITGIYESSKINRRKVVCNMKKRFSVKASTAAKKRNRVCASNNIRVYEGNDNYQNYVIVRDFNRGDDDTMIVDWDLSDDEVYDIADRVNTGRYNPDTDGAGESRWTTWDDATGSMNGVREVTASTKMKRNRVCASTEYPYLYVLKHGYGPGTLPKNVEVGRVEDYKGYTLVWLNRFLTTSELNEYDIPSESNLRRYLGDDLDIFSAKSIRGRKRVSASSKMKKFVKYPIKASNVMEDDVDELYRIANDEVLPTTELYRLAGLCDIDDDTFYYTYTGTSFGAYLTYIIHVGISSTDINLYSFMRKDWKGMFPDINPDNRYGNYVQINMDVMVSGESVSVDIADADVYENDTYSEYYSKRFESAFDVRAIEDHIKRIAEQAVNKIHSMLSQYIPKDDDIMESKKLRSRKRVSASKRMRKSIKCAEGYTTLRDRDITSADDVTELVLYITNDSDLYHHKALPIIENLKRKVKRGSYDDDLAVKAWMYLADDGVRKYDREFGSGRGSLTLLNKPTREAIARELRDHYKEQVFEDIKAAEDIYCAQDVSKDDVRELVLFITNEQSLYNQAKSIINNMKRKIKSGKYDEDKAVDAWMYLADAGTKLYDKRYGSGKGSLTLLNKATRRAVAEGLKDYFDEEVFEDVNASRSIHCSTITYNGNQYDADMVSQYYDMSITNYDDLGATTDQEFFDRYIELDPDFVSLFDYDIDPINSARSITCSDNVDLTVDLSNLELGDPYYEHRDDDPDTPDQWVLVIGKNPAEGKNYKLWYYMDSTDADLSELDLNNPDHIDLDEMSTMEDYDEIQLSRDIKCSTVLDKHGKSVDLVTM